MNTIDLIEKIKLKGVSGNPIPVTRITLTKDEFDLLIEYAELGYHLQGD